jgi:hypothetical protein
MRPEGSALGVRPEGSALGVRPEGSALLKGGLNRTLGVRHDAGDRTFCNAIFLVACKTRYIVLKDNVSSRNSNRLARGQKHTSRYSPLVPVKQVGTKGWRKNQNRRMTCHTFR